MKFLKKLIGEKCYLSPIDGQASEKVAEWSNNIEVSIRTGDTSDAITYEVQKGYLENMNNRGYAFYIVSEDNDEAVGIVRLMRVDLINRKAVLGMFIGEKSCWGKGIGTEATKLILDFGFNIINLKNIMIETFSFNERAIKTFKKCGFKEIGRRRKSIIYGACEYDEIYMDMLSEELNGSIINTIK